jgi:diacylglycerol kinase family enzyme
VLPDDFSLEWNVEFRLQASLWGLCMSNQSAILILNSGSGSSDKGKIAQELKSIAAAAESTCEVVMARGAREILHAARRAARSDYDVVIAAGGDGTINAVANALAGSGKRMGVLPLGTFNYFARQLGVPPDLETAFRTCFEGVTRPLTVGEVNGRIFLNNASIGLYPIILCVREKAYRDWGRSRLVAYWSLLKTLLRARLNMRLTLTVDGQRREVHTPLVFVGRNATQLEEFQAPGVRCVSEDGFVIYTLRPAGKIGLLRIAWRAFARKLQPQYDFDVFCATELRIEGRRILRTVAFDGERAKMLAPLDFRIRQNVLSVLVPSPDDKGVAA